ncbi:MAG: CehA/McbA family metallohydrolase, partial [Deltaproteobacteria bacterium]|nr:CehA/McbA family metallohydrolase [Deltaproteobacteria bacterium]
PTQPEGTNALLTVAGVTGSILSAPGVNGLAEWFSSATARPQGALVIPSGGRRYVLRDVVLGADLGELASVIHAARSAITRAAVGRVSGTVRSGGTPVAGARVSLKEADGHAAVFITDAQGRYAGTLPARSYDVAAWAPGRAPGPSVPLQLARGAEETVDLELPATRTLTVNVKEAGGGPLPARVTVLCNGGACPTSRSVLNRYTSVLGDPLLDSVQAIGWVPPTGTLSLQLPAGRYDVIVSRGPEYSVFPQDFRTSGGAAVDLLNANATLPAFLYRVVDSSGWMSADFHVHAVNSPDSPVVNRDRVLTFLGDGVDVLVSTDHDVVTDYAPDVAALGAEELIATVVGEEVSTMDFGHYNLFPLTRDPASLSGGALDWAGGRGPTLNPRQVFESGRALGAKTVHLNHPRGTLGAFTHMKVDTDTLATHADPRDFNMAEPPGWSAEDSLLFDGTFNAIEVLNSGEDGLEPRVARGRFNDWFTLLSRGLRVTATGVSDTHGRNVASGWRTFVKTATEQHAQLDPAALSASLNAQQAFVTNGPFLRVSAQRVSATGSQPTSTPAAEGGTVPARTDPVEVTVELQYPEYMDVSRVELFQHRPEDDDRCPRDPTSPRAFTSRVACNGVENLQWPESGVAAAVDVTPLPAELETVATVLGEPYKRWHVVRKLRLPAPATDNWIVAMVSGTGSLFPLLYRPASEGSSPFVVTPFAMSNPVFVDADGGGYDHPPFSTATRARPRTLPLGRAATPSNAPVSPSQLIRAWGTLEHQH